VVGSALHVTFGDPAGQTLLFENIGCESASFGACRRAAARRRSTSGT